MSAQAQTTFSVGDTVSFWTGRGSTGQATIREITGHLYFLDPRPDAVKGRDYRDYGPQGESWAPRDYGVALSQLNTPPQPWYENS